MCDGHTVSKVISLTGEQSVVVLARYRVVEEAPDAMDYKSLKKQGFLTKQGGGNSLLGRKNFKKRFFELRDGILSYSEQPNEPDLGVIVLKGVSLCVPFTVVNLRHQALFFFF
jgi:hypothetical protein